MRYIALLRAINVGGHTVTMARLRQLFEELEFTGVETFIASGNVIFDSAARSAPALEKSIQTRLHKALGFEVTTFLRTAAELNAVSVRQPFTPAQLKTARTVNIAFLHAPLDSADKRKLKAFRTPIDEFEVVGREVHWLCRLGQSQSKFSNAVLEKALGRPSTIRGLKTIQKMAAKYPGGDGRR